MYVYIYIYIHIYIYIFIHLRVCLYASSYHWFPGIAHSDKLNIKGPLVLHPAHVQVSNVSIFISFTRQSFE